MTNKDAYEIMDWEKSMLEAPQEFKDFYRIEEEIYNHEMREGQVILDAGFGSGRLLHQLNLKLDSKIIGIDNSKEMIERYSAKLMLLPGVFVMYGDLNHTPFADSTFDIVIIGGATFGNLAGKKKQVLREIKRILKPSGKMLFSVYSEKSLPIRLEKYKNDPLDHKVSRTGTVYGMQNGRVLISSEQYSPDKIEKVFKRYGGKELKIIGKTAMAYILEGWF